RTEPDVAKAKGRPNGGQEQSAQRSSIGRSAKVLLSPPKPPLDPEASAALRERLIGELNHLSSADDAANWARRRLSGKNTLTAVDAKHVEQAFQTKLATLIPRAKQDLIDRPMPQARKRRRKPQQVICIDKTVLTLSAPRRIRDREHVKSVAKQPCLICGRRPADAHHLRVAQSRALGRKVSDEFTVPLCRGHHREVHRCGDEMAWWVKTGIDASAAARVLWLKSHPLPRVIGQSGSKLQNE